MLHSHHRSWFVWGAWAAVRRQCLEPADISRSGGASKTDICCITNKTTTIAGIDSQPVAPLALCIMNNASSKNATH